MDKTSVRTKRPWGPNVRSDKTSVGTKRPWGQNVRGDKTSGGQNVRRTKRPADKTSVGTKRPSGSYLPGPCEAIFFTDKNLLSVKEEKSANTHTLSLCFLFFEVLHVYQNSLHPYYDIIKMHFTW